MTPVITFLAGFYLGILFFALLAVGRERKSASSAHIGRKQRACLDVSVRDRSNFQKLSSRVGQRPLSNLYPVFMEK
jgi:hypothetical protein